MSVINATPLLAAAGGDYQISRSVRLRSSASAYFNRTPASAGNRQTWTFSAWVKRGALGSFQQIFTAGTGGSDRTFFLFSNTDTIQFYSATATTVAEYVTSAVFRDPSAWYHVALRIDTTNATAANRVTIYVNGVQQSLTALTTVAQNASMYVNSTVAHTIGRESYTAANYLDGYLTEVNFIDGQALTPSSFGETDAITGVWKPKKYAGTYGTNGFYLNFSDNSSNTATTIGKDYSGNGNNWTPNNISVTAGVTYDSMIDVPTLYADGGNGRGNYATLNPLNSVATLTAGNLNYSSPSTAPAPAYSSIGMTSGKWYFEYTLTATNMFIGVWGNGNAGMLATGYPSYYWDIGASSAIGLTAEKSSGTSSGTLGNLAANDVYGIALDMDNTTVYFYKNNSLVQTVTGMTFVGALFFVVGSWSGANASSGVSNFGQRPFAYTPPTGFKALNTQNLPAPTILKGNQFFNATTYTGNGTTTGNTQAISNAVNGVSFQPDLVWIKSRSSGTQFHMWNDSVRGTNKLIYSNSTGAEDSLSNVFSSFNSDGFTVAYNSTYSQAVTNLNGSTYVAWQWKANGSAVTNTSGSITSQVNAGTSQGFSVVTWTGTGVAATVGHGLGVAPRFIIAKRRNAAVNWFVGSGAFPSWSYALEGLNTTAAANSGATAVWNATAPTSSVFSIGTDLSASGGTYVAYCFSEVAGFSKFGSYTGNGSADGPFVFCGFRPRFVMIKRTDSTGNWQIIDTARSTFNESVATLYPNLSNAEDLTNTKLDALANGFKIRGTPSTDFNTSGSTYIFAAFAESPFKNSLAR